MLHEALLSSAVLLLSAVRLHFATSPGSFDFVLLVAQIPGGADGVVDNVFLCSHMR